MAFLKKKRQQQSERRVISVVAVADQNVPRWPTRPTTARRNQPPVVIPGSETRPGTAWPTRPTAGRTKTKPPAMVPWEETQRAARERSTTQRRPRIPSPIPESPVRQDPPELVQQQQRGPTSRPQSPVRPHPPLREDPWEERRIARLDPPPRTIKQEARARRRRRIKEQRRANDPTIELRAALQNWHEAFNIRMEERSRELDQQIRQHEFQLDAEERDFLRGDDGYGSE